MGPLFLSMETIAKLLEIYTHDRVRMYDKVFSCLRNPHVPHV